MATHKWAYPSDWLAEHAETFARTGETAKLLALINHLMSIVPEDEIQDLFQEEMDRDGYFEEIDN